MNFVTRPGYCNELAWRLVRLLVVLVGVVPSTSSDVTIEPEPILSLAIRREKEKVCLCNDGLRALKFTINDAFLSSDEHFVTLSCRSQSFLRSSRQLLSGGQVVPGDEFPYFARIPQRSGYYCAGSLVAPDMVLTAPMCTYVRQKRQQAEHTFRAMPIKALTFFSGGMNSLFTGKF